MEPPNDTSARIPLVNTDLLGELVPLRARRYSWITRLLAGLAALLLTIIGIVGIILPIMPGWPFLVFVPPLLGIFSERTRGWINAIDRKMPLRLRLLIRPKARKKLKKDNKSDTL